MGCSGSKDSVQVRREEYFKENIKASAKFGDCSSKTPAIAGIGIDAAIGALAKTETDIKMLMEGISLKEFVFQEFGAAEEPKHHHMSFVNSVAKVQTPTKEAPDAREDKDYPVKYGSDKAAADAPVGVCDIVMTAEECKLVDTVTVYLTKEPSEFHSINFKCGDKTFGHEAPTDMAKYQECPTVIGDNGHLIGFKVWTRVTKDKDVTQHKITGIQFLHIEHPLPAFESEAAKPAAVETGKAVAKQTEDPKPTAEVPAPVPAAE